MFFYYFCFKSVTCFYMNEKTTFSVSFYQRLDKIDKNNTAPVFMRVTVNGERAEISTNKRFSIASWENGAPFGNKEETKNFRKHLNTYREKAFEIKRDMLDRNENITAERIKNRFIGKDKDSKTLMEVFHFHNEQMKSLIGKDFTSSTVKRYDTTLSHVKEYLKKDYKTDDILLSELKYEFISGFDYFLKTVHKCNHNTTMKYIKNFKKIVHLALKNDWIPKDPFIRFECHIEPIERNILTKEELTKIENKRILIPRIEQVRDIFVFCCYTGLAYIDVSKLSYEHIVTGIDGEKWINLNRTKTKTKSQIPLLPKALEILDKYKPLPKQDPNALLPVITNQRMNAYLKELADICEISKTLTFHIARHTFATTVTLTNGVPIESVSAMLGHKSIRTTQIYSKVVEEKLSNDMSTLRDKLTGADHKVKLAK